MASLPLRLRMTTNYDPIADQYRRSKQQPWRTFVEASTLLSLVGDVRGLTVLDVACGEGYYTRQLRSLGAARVTGIDLSARMIDMAREQEARFPQGIEYQVGDARHLSQSVSVDLVVAAYLLNYARTRAELQAMCRGIADSLRPGGRFVTVNCSMSLDFTRSPDYRPYGFSTNASGPWGEESPVTWTFQLDDGTFEIENYHLSQATYEQVLQDAGFSEIVWHLPGVSQQGRSQFGDAYWSTLLTRPPISFIECVRSRSAG